MAAAAIEYAGFLTHTYSEI